MAIMNVLIAINDAKMAIMNAWMAINDVKMAINASKKRCYRYALLLLWRHVLLKILTGFGNTAFLAFGVAGNANIAAV